LPVADDLGGEAEREGVAMVEFLAGGQKRT